MENRDLASVKSKLQKTSDEETFELALQEPRLHQLPGNVFTDKDHPLKQTLRAVFFMVGLRPENYPTDEDKALLLAFIVENYGGHTVAEIRLAFKLAITGKLDLPLRDVKCYENFSVLYFASIMEAYRKWAVVADAHLEKVAIPKMREYSEQDKKAIDLDYRCAMAADYWKKLRNLKKPLGWEKQL